MGTEKIFTRRQFKAGFANLLNEIEIPTNLSKEEAVKRYSDLFSFVEPHIPSSLYRFRRCNLDSVLDVEQGRISVCTANRFTDKYDSTVYYNHETLIERIQAVSHIFFPQLLIALKTNPSAFPSNPIVTSVIQMISAKESDKVILSFLSDELWKRAPGWIAQVQLQEQWPRNYSSTRIACFTERIKSKFMWDAYAGGYSGFSLEYDFRNWRALSKDNTPVCLFPVVYSSTKMDATEIIDRLCGQDYMRLMGAKDSDIQAYSTAFPLDYLYWVKMYLYKDKTEYGHEKEWRLLELPHYSSDQKKKELSSILDVGCLKAIYYGPEMGERYKSHLRDIAKQKGIREYDVIINSNSRRYELGIIRLK